MKTNVKIAIKSCHRFSERRQAQRDTWLKEYDGDFFFILGGSPTTEADVLYAPVSDAFADIALKVLVACEYALNENVTHLFLCDDDTYVRSDRLLRSGFEQFDYLGFVRNYTTPPYMQGSSLWLSARAMEFIVKQPTIMRPGIPDDLAIGKCLYGNVPYVHEHRFSVGDPCSAAPQPDNDLITYHKSLPDAMRRIHAQWSSQKSR